MFVFLVVSVLGKYLKTYMLILIIKISEIPGRLFYKLPFFSINTSVLLIPIKDYRINRPCCHRAKMAVPNRDGKTINNSSIIISSKNKQRWFYASCRNNLIQLYCRLSDRLSSDMNFFTTTPWRAYVESRTIFHNNSRFGARNLC